MKEMHTDIAIIGGGCAGTAAAAAAVESGAKVIVFEKGKELAFGGNGPFAIESRIQRQKNITTTREDVFRYFMDHTHYRADARLLKAYLDKSAGTMDWLEESGAKFIDARPYIESGFATWHVKDRNSPRITDALADRAKKKGATILLETPGKKILKENGRTTGLIAEDSNGDAILVKSKAVIVATGGFSENAEMVKKYTGFELYKDIWLDPGIQRHVLDGDGIRMTWEAGGAETEMYMASYRGLPAPHGGPGGAGSQELSPFRQPNLMVNLAGERFVNEEICSGDGCSAGNAVHKQKDGCAFTIFDEAARKHYDEAGPHERMPGAGPAMPLGAFMKKAQSEGYQHFFMTDTLEDLCVQTGIDINGLRNTINEYNEDCQTGRDSLFYKKTEYLLPVKQPMFYAARFFCDAYVELGGVKINDKTEVLAKNFDVIPGLYCVGNDSNTLSGDTYVFACAGHFSGFAFNTGRIAGENAARYILDKK